MISMKKMKKFDLVSSSDNLKKYSRRVSHIFARFFLPQLLVLILNLVFLETLFYFSDTGNNRSARRSLVSELENAQACAEVICSSNTKYRGGFCLAKKYGKKSYQESYETISFLKGFL